MMVGDHPSTCSTPEMTSRARFGEQTQWMTEGHARRVPSKSRGRSLILGVRYSNLRKRIHTGRLAALRAAFREAGRPSMVAPVEIQCSGGAMIIVTLAKQPHFAPVGQQPFEHVLGKVVAAVDYHT